MTADLATLNAALATFLDIYYATASQRAAEDPSFTPPVDGRPVHFFRGMMDFEPSPRFLEKMGQEGFHVHVFRPTAESRHNLLVPWTEKVSEAVDHFARHPESIEDKTVFVGHSAGGFVIYVLAAIAKGVSLERIKSALPHLKLNNELDFLALQQRLQGKRFVSIATPYSGITMTALGSVLHQRLVDPLVPHFFSAVSDENLASFYTAMGKHPSEVMDGLVYGATSTLDLEGGLVSLAVNALAQGALRVLSRFVVHPEPGDGIVPVESAAIASIFSSVVRLNHLHLVETEAGAQALSGVIRTLG